MKAKEMCTPLKSGVILPLLHILSIYGIFFYGEKSDMNDQKSGATHSFVIFNADDCQETGTIRGFKPV
ncbi:hypothetical protein CEH05_10300 [Halobacillus halophilus]|nr:hypothetical protein CEH05_10300 [Halobacillus halophilus]